jgi:hypothetical protein
MPNTASDIVTADIVRKFGLIYAGGALAIEGVKLPWNRSDLLRAILKCCIASLGTLSSEQRTRESGRAMLKTWLFHLPRHGKINRTEYASIDGYVVSKADQVRCVVKTDKFKRIFDNPMQRDLVMHDLIRRGQITRSRTQENQKQFVWPDGVRRRSLEIKWGKVA